MHAITRNCHKHSHPEFSLSCDDAEFLAPGLKWLVEWIENEVARGKHFIPEQTVQVGWSVLEVRQRADGSLGFFEPDFKSMPAVFVDSVSNTLLHLLLQKSVNQSLGLENEMVLSSWRHSAIICTDFGVAKDILLSRTPPKGADSGWFFGCRRPDHNHQEVEQLRRVSLYEAAVLLDDRIVPYLALPAGIEVLADNSGPSFTREGKELQIKPSSYLHKKFEIL